MTTDICLLRSEVVGMRTVDSTLGDGTEQVEYGGSLTKADIFCEVRKGDEDDPCDDNPGPGGAFFKEMKSEDTQKKLDATTGQIASYAMAILSRQYRTHCFSIGVFGSKARFYRWDRAGVVISRAFDYKEKPLLSEFARRYCQATDAQRGLDLSVCKATEEEEMKFSETIRKHVIDLYALNNEEAVDELVNKHYGKDSVFKIKIWPQKPKDLRNSQNNSDPQNTNQPQSDLDEMKTKFVREYRIEDIKQKENTFDDVGEATLALEKIGLAPSTGDGAGEEKKKSLCRKYADMERFQYFLVSRPIANSISIAGRATRGYWAVRIPDTETGDDPNDYRICFLKDTWRIATEEMEKEGDIMVELIEAGVDFISDILSHGDVGLSEDETCDASREYIVYEPLFLIVAHF